MSESASTFTSAKYRPVLTASQILHLLSLCKSNLNQSSLECIAVLAPFEFKIRNGLISPAYTPQPIPTLAQSMGFDDPPTESIPSIRKSTTHIESLYEMWRTTPSTLSLEQLKEVQAYRYKNNLMSPEQEQEYETALLGVSQPGG